MYFPRYLILTTPAMAVVMAVCIVTIARKPWPIAGVVLLFAAAAVPNYLFIQRWPYAKEGWDYSQVADLISSHAAPGDCLMVDNTVPWRPGPIRALLATRPAAFRSLIDVERGVYGPKVGSLWDGHVAVWLTTAKINKCATLWTITDHDKSLPDHQAGQSLPPGPHSGVPRRIDSPATSGSTSSSGGNSITRRSSSRRADGGVEAPSVGSSRTCRFWLASPLLGGDAQGARHVIELLAAFGLTALIGLERTIQGKSAGLRTQTIVGTSSALIMLVSKFGFFDIVHEGTVALDPSRVAAQIVSGVGFLGAGIIITRRGAVHGLTTAAAVWESAAIGMAVGAGLLLLAITVVALHFVSALAFSAVERQLNARLRGTRRLHHHLRKRPRRAARGAATVWAARLAAHRTRRGRPRYRRRRGPGDDDAVGLQDGQRDRRFDRRRRGCRRAARRRKNRTELSDRRGPRDTKPRRRSRSAR